MPSGDVLSKGYMEVTPEVGLDILRHVFKHLNPLHTVCMLGEPGCGKTEINLQAIIDCNKEGIFPPPLSLQDQCDLRGLPTHNHATKRTEWYVPAWLPDNKKFDGVIFLDEAPQGSFDTIKPLGQLLTSRRIDNYCLPQKARWSLAGNRRSDSAGAGKFPTPVINRISMIGMIPSPDSWSSWAKGVANRLQDEECVKSIAKVVSPLREDTSEFYAGPGSISPIVLSYFTKLCREHFSTFDPARQAPFCSARSITRLSEFLSSSPPEHIILPYACGLIGSAVGTQFVDYMRIWKEVPDFDRVIEDANFPLPRKRQPGPIVCH